MKKWFNIYLIFVLCNGCSSDKVETQTAPEISFESTNLINPLFFSEENLFNISFPLWFDNGVVSEFNIDSIYIDLLVLGLSNDSIIQEERDYSYNFSMSPEGKVKKSTFTGYYGLTTLVEATFDYSKSVQDSLGYCLPRIEKTSNMLIGTNPTKLLRSMSDLQRFNRLELVRQDEDVVVFKNSTSPSHEYHIFITRPKSQNILFVDKLVSNPDDVFYYGFPYHFSKAFCLTNLVKEDIRSEITFYENERYPKTYKRQQNGLLTTTNYLYNDSGKWMGQLDSLRLNSGQFVKLTSIEVLYDENGLPNAVEIKKGASYEELRTIKIIKLNYAFRKPKN
ncbi:MAG: hypothetical protein O3A15_07850 [Proteobacteria bacterium]|nr:hypothetical protein [Pseudomonadota bacterium]